MNAHHTVQAVVRMLTVTTIALAGCSATEGRADVTTSVRRLTLGADVTQVLPSRASPSVPFETTSAVPSTTEAASETHDPAITGLLNSIRSAESVLITALQSPRSADSIRLIEATTSADSPARAGFENQIASAAASGLTRTSQSALDGTVTIEVGPSFLSPTSVVVTVCAISAYTSVLLDQGGERHRLPPVLEATRFIEVFELVEDTWLLVERDPIESYQGVTTCDE